MNCIYKYKGKTFNSEMALNDYLLVTETLKPVLGDLVYQLSEKQQRYAKNLKEAENTYKDLKDRGIQIDTVKKENLEPDELDDVGSLKYPYISVTDLIHTMPSRYTDQVFPIFNSENYFQQNSLNMILNTLIKKYSLNEVIKSIVFSTTLNQINLENNKNEPDLQDIINQIYKEVDPVKIIQTILELHIAEEETKYGLTPEGLRELLAAGEWRSMEHVRICGLMMMASYVDDEEQIRSEFRLAKSLFDEVKAQYFADCDYFCERSWGMSHDYLLAVQEGSTMVRVGTTIFGPRVY